MLGSNTPFGEAVKLRNTDFTDPVVSKELDAKGEPYIEVSRTCTYYIPRDKAEAVKDRVLQEKQDILDRDLEAEAAEKQVLADKIDAITQPE